MVQPPNFEGPNVAVEALFGMWVSFRTSKTMWRPNLEMPRRDVMPEDCLWTLTVAKLSEQRPVHSVPPTRPLDPKVLPAAPHVDQAAFPALPSSSNEDIGGIPGTKDFPLGTTKKPDESTVVPRPITGKTVAPSTTTTTGATPSPAVTSAVATTTTTTTLALSSSLPNGKQQLEPKVTVQGMSPRALEDARAKLAAKADPNLSGQGKTSSKGTSLEEPMEVETTRPSRQRSSSHVRTHCSRSQSSTRDKDGKGAGGKSSSTQTTTKPKESEKRPGHSGSVAMSEMLLKAGSVKPPGKDVGPMPKFTPDKEYKVDYSREPCLPPTFRVDQPSGSHLAGAPDQPKSTWHTNPNMSQATLHTHLQALAQGGFQQASFRSQQGWFRTRTEAMHVWDRSNDAFKQIAWEPVFVDEDHVGAVLASSYELQRHKDAMKAELKTARKDLETACQNTKDELKTTGIQDKCIVSLISN